MDAVREDMAVVEEIDGRGKIQNIGPSGGGKSAVATPNGRSQAKKKTIQQNVQIRCSVVSSLDTFL